MVSLGDAHYFEEMGVKKFEEIRVLLDNRETRDKLEGMKRLIAMISIGRDASSFFPDVVKNVVCESLEVKKLVYTYLVHYAEIKPEIALLSINTFQKDLSDKNQLIRALALRVMSSIRVHVIVQLVVLAVKKCSKDSSPYVRKAAAHAVGKIFSLDQEQKDVLVEIIASLLNDNSNMVLGSALAAFNEVCPERLDMLHPHFRKLCRLCADCDEWGQIVILNTLTRYSRTQFEDPEKNIKVKTPKAPKPKGEKKQRRKKKSGFYSDSGSDDSDSQESSDSYDSEYGNTEDEYRLEEDHRLLLKCTAPLLQNRNTGVVMAVASLFHYMAPRPESAKVGKALVRIMKTDREAQYVVLANIATLVAQRPEMFEPYLKEFFVKSTDPTFNALLKLEILTRLMKEANSTMVLKEFQAYVRYPDNKFVTAVIQAIGRCASYVPALTEQCLRGLLALMRNSNEVIVAESVIVMRSLLQKHPKNHQKIIESVSKMFDVTQVPTARACVMWVIAEYYDSIPLVGPDTLRKVARTFAQEAVVVKLQALNMGAKLFLKNPEQCTLLFKYVLDLAYYDANYDVRDRQRLLRAIVFDGAEKVAPLHERATEIFLSEKPAPVLVSPFQDRERFTLNSLSHIVNHTAYGYQPLPDFSEEKTDSRVRDPRTAETYSSSAPAGKSRSAKQRPAKDLNDFYESESESESGSGSGSGSGSESESGSASGSGSGSGSESGSESETSRSRSGSESSSGSSSGSSRSRSPSPPPKPKKTPKEVPKKPAAHPKKATKEPAAAAQTGSLIAFGDEPSPTPASAAATSGGDSLLDSLDALSPTSSTMEVSIAPPVTALVVAGPAADLEDLVLPRLPLLHYAKGCGMGVDCTFIREVSMYGSTFNVVKLYIRNHNDQPILKVKVGQVKLESNCKFEPFTEIPQVGPQATMEVNVHVDFNLKTNGVKFELVCDRGAFMVDMRPPLGELVRAAAADEASLNATQKALGGMHENTATISIPDVASVVPNIVRRVLTCLHACPVIADVSTGQFKFSSATLTNGLPLVVQLDVDLETGKTKCRANSESTVLQMRILEDIKKSLLAASS